MPSSKQLQKEKKKEGMRRRKSKTSPSDDVSVADSIASESVAPTIIEPDTEPLFPEAGVLTDTGGKTFDGWRGKYRIPCQNCSVKHQHRRSVFLLIDVQDFYCYLRAIFLSFLWYFCFDN